MSDGVYRRPDADIQIELEVKKSRFVVDLCLCTGSPKTRLNEIRAQQPKAGHHCWAYVIGHPSGHQVDSSDDGEPKGCAGKPMLSMLQGMGVGDTLVVVSRYFGGIKLGTGGLVRAYSGAVREAIDQARFQEVEPKARLRIEFPYSHSGLAESVRREWQAELVASEFQVQVIQTWQVPKASATDTLNAVLALQHLGFVAHKQ